MDSTEPPLTVHQLAAALLQAIRHDDVSTATALLDKAPQMARYSIHTAAAVGDVDGVRGMLQANATRVTQTLPADETLPLVYAVQSALKRARGVSIDDHVAIVHALLDAGADPNTAITLPDVHGSIPVLYFPCNEGNVPVARLLLERGANPTDGESLYHAAQQNHRDVLQLLVEFGADVSRGPADTGNTPLHFLASFRATNSASTTAMRGLQWLLEHGADPNVPLSAIGDGQHSSQRGETPLHRLVASGYDATVVEALVARGANVNAARLDGATPYALAVRNGNQSAIAYLASVGADTTRVSPLDQLLGACRTGNDVEARALAAQHPTLVPSLNANDAGALHIALYDNDLPAVQLMLSLGWPLAHESEWGGTALHWAAWNGRVDMVRWLLQYGAPVNVRDTRYGSSPIAWAAHGSRYCERANDVDYPAIVHLLLDAGATRAASFNAWNEAPERLARESVIAVLAERGFLQPTSEQSS